MPFIRFSDTDGKSFRFVNADRVVEAIWEVDERTLTLLVKPTVPGREDCNEYVLRDQAALDARDVLNRM